ncbi:cytochrome P450 [Diaporthe sp. PMI_573]|nr:cytochrome P450 [Diaporthaceae sp. PMI_573]
MWTWVHADWNGKRAQIIRELHEKYGNVVRIGPREVSCANPAAIPLLYGPTGPSNTFVRGPWYKAQSMLPDVHSLQNEPTLPEHSRRRRDWDPAFSIKALAGYKSNIQRNAETLLDQVARLSRDGLVDIRECMMWFGFDVMGELGFGRSFGTLEAAKTSDVVHLVELGVRSINSIGNVPYVAHVMRFLPSPIQKFEAWLSDAVEWRMSHHGEKEFVDADVFAYLLGEQGKQRRKLDRRELQQDCMLMVVAGSDTTSNTMTFCLYELARHPKVVARLREELALPDDARGSQGKIVLPPDTVASTHTWTIHHDPNNFYDADSFTPDRWMEIEEGSAAHNVKAWAPFGYGSTSYIGKNLAYMEMRAVLAQFIVKFDFSITPDDDRRFRESVRDQFVVSAGAMKLQIAPWKRGS